MRRVVAVALFLLASEARAEATVHVLRLDDHGIRAQGPSATELLGQLRASGAKLVVVFVHGWKHNAEPHDTNLMCFRRLVQVLSTVRKEKVFGVYIGWNAKPKGPEALWNASFWTKKELADTIAQQGEVTGILAALKDQRKDGVRLVVIGHSFGARLVFNAIQQTIIEQVKTANPPDPNGKFPVNSVQTVVQGFGDLVVLINPAFEAQLYTVINRFNCSAEQFRPEQPPILLTIAAENDCATIEAWPAAANTDDPKMNTTLDNYRPYRTHWLLPYGTSPPTHGPNCSMGSSAPLPGDPARDCAAGETLHAVTVGKATKACLITSAPDPACSAIPASNNPFIVAQATRSMINGHNGFFTEPFVSFLIISINDAISKRTRIEHATH